MRFGICCGPGSFAPELKDQPAAAVPALLTALQESGADYVEFGVASIMPAGGQAEYDALRRAMEPYPLKVEAFNSFIPARHRITGPEVDLPQVLDYCRTALTRCKELGASVVVLGSAGARKVPEGFDPGVARCQLVEFCRELGPVAQEIGIDIALEPLNRREDNLIITVPQGAALVDDIGHPRIQLLADLYHMTQDSEPLGNVAAAGARLRHTHVADLERAAPGFASSGEAAFLEFFRSLRRAGYDARCSFEGVFQDIAAQAQPLIAHLRRRWEESAVAVNAAMR